MRKILITGGTGAVGSCIIKTLEKEGHQVHVLSRSPEEHQDTYPQAAFFAWNIRDKTIDTNAFEGVDTVIHLAGKNVAEGRWTDKRRQEILDSRIESAKLLYDTIEQLEHKPRTFVSASAIGYYGGNKDTLVNEESPAAKNDFLAEVCIQWELAADRFASLGLRVVKIRIGVVLDTDTGVLQKLVPVTKAGLAAPLGKGDQYMSWIHIKDLARLFVHTATNEEVEGVLNGVADNPETNRDFTKTLADVLNRPMVLPKVPAFVLKGAMGQMAEIALDSIRVDNQRMRAIGFECQFKDLSGALNDLLN